MANPAILTGVARRFGRSIRSNPPCCCSICTCRECHGSELLPRLRRVRGRVPAIAVTADGVFDIACTGVDEVWIKPLDLSHVLRCLDELLGPEYEPTDAALLI